jgi:single-stranded-DNA-specific exonuclease
MGKPELSVELLLTDRSTDADRLAIELCRLNIERRSLETEIFEEAKAMLPEFVADEPIILARHGWFQGVTGIVAAKMAERYLVPAIIISLDEDGIGRGSCRSYGNFGLYDALRSCEDILNNYGGHEMAAGVTIAKSNIDELRRRLISYYQDSIKVSPMPGLFLDFEVEKPELLTVQNVQALERLEPFGNGNPSPCLCIKDAVITTIYPIGAGKHTRLKIEKAGTNLDCVFFSMPSEDLGVSEGSLIDVAFEPQINEFRGRSSVQLNLVAVRAASGRQVEKGMQNG